MNSVNLVNEVSAEKMIASQAIIAEKIAEFTARCKELDPGCRVEYNMIGFGEGILTTVNSENAQVNYSIGISASGDINIARII